MATLNNWAFVRVHFSDNSKKFLTMPTNNSIVRGDPFYIQAIMGACYGKIGVKDGTVICTKTIKSMEDSYAVIVNGEICHLARKNPDYVKFEKAVDDGITILRNWIIHREKDTCYLKVKDDNGVETCKKILSREDWVVTFEDGSTAFLDWASVDKLQLKNLKMFVF